MRLSTLVASSLLGVWLLAVTVSAGNDNTYVVNDSSKAIVATINYQDFHSPASSRFTNRIINAKQMDHDTYLPPETGVCCKDPTVAVKIFISGAPASQTVTVKPDRSVLIQDRPGGGITMYQAQYGGLHSPDGGELAHL